MTAAVPALDQPPLDVRLGDPAALAAILARTGAIEAGHFELLAGAHTDRFIRFSRVASQDTYLEMIGQWLLPTVAAWSPDLVVSPTTAGVALAATLARRLAIPVAFAEVGADGRATTMREPFDGRRALLINDLVTTGAGLAALAAVVKDAGATVAGAAWFVTRGTVSAEDILAAPTAAIGEVLLEAWQSDECPLCASGDQLTSALEIN
jgi:orotate phosphoribosyltransferase